MCKNLPPFFYDGGMLPEELEEDIDYDEYPFLPSQAATIRKELSEAAKRGGKDDNVVAKAWKKVKEHAAIARMQLRLEWGEKRNKKPRYRMIQELKRLSDRKACGQDVPQKLFDAILYGVVVAGIMEPEWHDKPDPDDGSHPGEPYIRQLSVKQVTKAVEAACDPNGMIHMGKGGRPKGSIREEYIKEIVNIWIELDGGNPPLARDFNNKPAGHFLEFVRTSITPLLGPRSSPEPISSEHIFTIIKNFSKS